VNDLRVAGVCNAIYVRNISRREPLACRPQAEGFGLVKIAEGVQCIEAPCNCFLLETSEGLVLIDTGIPGSHVKILQALKARSFRPEQLAHIVVTHAHVDHMGGLAALVRATGAQTWAHAADAPLVERAAYSPVSPMPGPRAWLIYRWLHLSPFRMEPARVDHRIQNGDVLFRELKVIHAPGHCAGQIVLLWPQKRILFAADSCINLFKLEQALMNEDHALGLQSLRRISALDFKIACFGHGKPIMAEASTVFRKTFL
jgi:glyoxylase-like metal-dependent hydrolase (beta-lactamase superfamily II)